MDMGQVHPRPRGEHQYDIVPIDERVGSSTPTRGTPARTVKYIEYLLDPIEPSARGYAQYIPTKTADKKLLDQVEAIIQNGRYESERLSQWTTESFEPIQKSFDSIFEEMGWLKRI